MANSLAIAGFFSKATTSFFYHFFSPNYFHGTILILVCTTKIFLQVLVKGQGKKVRIQSNEDLRWMGRNIPCLPIFKR